jgi:hypothetical protein
MNFLVFCPFAFIISKNIRLHLFELIKDEAALKVRYSKIHIMVPLQFILKQSLNLMNKQD